MSSARSCMQIIATLSKEEDEIKFDLLAGQVTLEMLRCLLLLSSSGQGVLYLTQPPLIRGCIRLMKTIKVDSHVSPFSYEYGYLCFNIAKMALGCCLVEKFNKQHIAELMERIWANYQTKDNPSILTEQLSEIFLNETTKSSPREARCDWIFGWSDPPAHGGHPNLIVAESDALDLMNVLWNDRKAFLKSLSSTYTPGALIILLLIWQYMLRNGLQRDLPDPGLQTPLLGPFLDLSWRFALVAMPADYALAYRTALITMFYLEELTESAVDMEDSRTIINAYIKSIPIIEDTVLYRQVALGLYPHLPRFVVRNILPGTADLFPALIKTILGRMWEMALWQGVEHAMPPVAVIASGFDDLLLFLQVHVPRLPPQSSVMQLILEELAGQDLLGLVGFTINRLDPTRASNPTMMHHDPTSCMQFKNLLLFMLVVLSQASSTCTIPSYFPDYETEWIKHLQYNDVLLQMAGNSESARSCAEFRRELLWDVIKRVGRGDEIKKRLRWFHLLSCDYERCPVSSWVGYAPLWCSSCIASPGRANYCSSQCQVLDWSCEGQHSHRNSCPRSD
ncbi:hypothetical protein RSAG8_13155, partial [Rhizoctonia solani AG-8 WAC10335]